MALVAMAKQLRRHDILVPAQRHYGKALKKLANGLQRTEVAKHDGTLIAMFLLGLYEVIIYDGPQGQSKLNRIHSQGRLAVLRLRGSEQLKTKTGRNLFTLLYHQQLIGSFLHGGSVMEEFPKWMNDLYPTTPMSNLETLMHNASSLVSGIRRSLQTKETEMLLQLFLKGIEMEEILERMSHEIPAMWPYPEDVIKRLAGTDRPADLPQSLSEKQLGDLPENLSQYRGVSRALVMNIYRAVRIHLLEAVTSAIPPLRKTDTVNDIDFAMIEERSLSSMKQASGSICDDVRIAIGDYDRDGSPMTNPICGRAFRAWSQLWPLQSALSVKLLSDRERERLEEMLEYVKEVVGINMATEVTPHT
ncbi:hypothetical protein N0V90_007885 [Kalmusia sp. IMI 367209]|nr:hypothetical protein N0V90_007885 [Kalmusia sp. IMI 367209]